MAIAHLAPASATTIIYPLSVCKAMSGNCTPASSPYGSVTVSTVNADDVSVTVTLGSDANGPDVFSVAGGNGAGKPLLFDPSVSGFSVTNIKYNNVQTAAWTWTQQSMTMADGTGKWNNFIDCLTACGNGTSGNLTGPLSFDITDPNGITPADFLANSRGFVFASDIGVATGAGKYNTGDVAAVPLPAAVWLLLSGLGGLGAARHRSLITRSQA